MNKGLHRQKILDCFFGAIAGVLLVLSFQPFGIKFLALLSSVIFVLWFFSFFENKNPIQRSVYFLLPFLFLSRGLFFIDNYFLLVNKTLFSSWLYPVIYIFMLAQITILPLSVGIFLSNLVNINQHRINNFFFLLIISLFPLSIDVASYWTHPISPVIALVSFMPFSPLFSLLGHWGVSFFYYVSLVLIISFVRKKKKQDVSVLFLIFSFISAAHFLIINFKKTSNDFKKLVIITINQPFNVINNENDFSPNIKDYLINVSKLYSEELKNPDSVVFLWNESALVQLPGKSEKLKEVFSMIKKILPAHHFIGSFPLELNTAKDLTGTPTYSYLKADSLSRQEYRKRYFVPLDENLDFFPWLPRNKFVKPILVQRNHSLSYFQIHDIKIGILLCNEIAETIRLEHDGFFKNLDLIISPSNVPQFFHNHYEGLLNDYALWVNYLSAVPVLRSSNSNIVTLFNRGLQKKVSSLENHTHKIEIILPTFSEKK